MKNNAQKINFLRLVSLVFKTFETLNHDLILRTLSSVYIHGLKGMGGMYTSHEILTSTYGMELKFALVLVFDRSRR